MGVQDQVLAQRAKMRPPSILQLLPVFVVSGIVSAIAIPSSRWLIPNQLQENLSRNWLQGKQLQKLKLSHPLGIYASPFLKRWNSGIGIPSWLRNSTPGSWRTKKKRGGAGEDEVERLPACLLPFILQLATDEWCNNNNNNGGGGDREGVRCSAATRRLRELSQQELIRCSQYLTPQALVRPGVRIH